MEPSAAARAGVAARAESRSAAGVSFESLESRVVLAVVAPTGLEATLVAPRAVAVAWNDVAGETGYVVERRVDGTTEPWGRVGETGADVTRFTQDGLAAGKTYLYRVRAREGDAASEPSNVDAVTVPGESTVPLAPRLEANYQFLEGAHTARLQWTNVANETGYKVERRVDGSADDFAVVAELGADVAQYRNGPLDAGKTYLYRVRAVNARGSSAASNTVAVVVPGAGAPSAPRELVAELVQGRFVRLRWVDVAGETGYRVERRLNGSGSGEWVQVGNTAANVVTFADERVERGRTYVYRVRAFNEVGSSPYSNTAAVSVPAEVPTPPAPGELDAQLTDARRVRLTWNNVAGEKGYKVERRVDGTDAWVQIGATAQDVTTFVDERVEGGKTYIYRVRAFNDAGNSPYSNTDSVRVPGEAATPAAPRLEAQLVAPRAAKLSWTNVANETGYRVERRVDGSPEAWREVRSVGADVITVTDDGLEPGRTYLYRVRAFNAAGNSPYSNTAFVRVLAEGLPTAPREVRAVVASATRVELRWIDSALENGYRVERRVDGTDAWVKVGTAPANATGFVDNSVTAGKTYVYRVRAFNDVGASPWSNTAVAKVTGEPSTPVAPRLEAGLVAPRAARLHWTNVANETGYRVERRIDGSDDAWAVIGTTGADVTTLVNDGLGAGKTYLYRVRAFNAAGASAYSNVVGVRVAGDTVTRPAAPRELRAVAVSPTQVDLRWGGVEGGTGYRIERRLDGTSTWEKVAFTAADVTRFSDKGVQPGKTYVYRVRAQGPTEPSAWSNTAAVKTPEATAAGATAGLFSDERIAPPGL